uniref:Uncharacterized protein n=1 Tax=Siphoviridae sp. ctLsx2 TaxID=2826254 RepID=A0A8S5QSI4_9CAUD|nr:MAG TPA: hypothetical protein [Siphoviridae sp. ctLsx2]
MGDAGANSASPSLFLFPLLFLMGGASAPPGGRNARRTHGERTESEICRRPMPPHISGSGRSHLPGGTKSGGHYRWAMA